MKNRRGIMPDWVTYVVLILTSVGSAVGAMSTILKPMKNQMAEIVARELEKEKEEQRMRKLEAWTEKQQIDLDNLNEGVVILASTSAALLDHAIVKQEGNGKCHKAQEEVEKFLKAKALNKNSHT